MSSSLGSGSVPFGARSGGTSTQAFAGASISGGSELSIGAVQTTPSRRRGLVSIATQIVGCSPWPPLARHGCWITA
jgi:hypothetical protein